MESTALEGQFTNQAFYSLATNPFKFRLYLLQNLPAAYFSGISIKEVNGERSVVKVPFKWFTRNPFRSTYFACLSMAAEMSTGILAMAALYRKTPKVSMLIVSIEGKFYKKATGITSFVCVEGLEIHKTIKSAIDSGEAKSIKVFASGENEYGELVAEFWCEWSFKRK